MISNQTKKIFLNKFDDLSTLISQVELITDENIVIVLPEGSLVFSSPLNLKILAKVVYSTGKQIIFITEDDFGYKAIQQSSLVVVNKFSQITPDLWDVVVNRRISYIKKQNAKKAILDKKELDVDSKNIGEPDLEDSQKEVDLDESYDFDSDNVKYHYSTGEQIAKKNFTEIAGIKIFQGSDIAIFNTQADSEYVRMSFEERKNEMNQRGQEIDSSFRKSINSGDFSKLARQKKRKGVFSSLFGKKLKKYEEDVPTAVSNIIQDRDDNYSSKPFSIPGKYLIPILLTVLLIVVLVVVWVFSGSRVIVRVDLKKEEVLTTKQVKLNFETEDVDIEKSILPAKMITVDTESISGTGEATGKGLRGTKSTGFLYIFNKTEADITLAQGTKILNLPTGLEYILTSAVTVPASTKASDLSLNPGRKDDVGIEATNFGENYDILVTDGTANLRISGYDGVSILQANLQSDIKGGASTEFRSVSKENIDALAKSLTDRLRTQSSNKLDISIPEGYVLIQSSVKFEVTETKANPAENQEVGSDNTFNLSLRSKISGYVVKRTDILLILQSSDEQDRIKSVENFTIDKFNESNGSITIEISAQGQLRSNLSEDQIKQLIYGLSLMDAEKLISGREDVNSVKIEFYPQAIPEGLRNIPTSSDKVIIEFSK